MGLKNEIGNTYGLLTVVERGPNTPQGRAQWQCICECGNQTLVLGKNLRSGNTKSCGCLKNKQPAQRVDLTGKRFGRLLVLGEPQKGERGTIWKCLCDCGTICYKVSTDMVHDNTKSCGCYKSSLHSTMNDLTNQNFGDLIALYTDKVANDGQRVWTCKCSCGTIIDVRAGALRQGKTQSCGCKTSHGNQKIKAILSDKKINFKEEYSFKDLFYKSQNHSLRFDFAIFQEDKILCLIEYNGKQHYEPIEYFGGIDEFIEQQNRDKLKLEYCIKNNYNLFIIKYNDNIEEKMEEILNELYGE